MENGKASVIVIGGFLGAGKTTLMKRILSWQTDLSDTVVIVNEFGEVGIDGSMLKSAGSDVVELTSGCICCSLKADLGLALKRIRQQFNPRRILIETTGVADPTGVVDVFHDPELQEHMHVTKVITVLDAELWEGRDNFGPLFFNQLQEASLILLNKIDTVDERKVSQFLGEIHQTIAHCQVIPTLHCEIGPDILLGGISRKSPRLRHEPEKHDHDHDYNFHLHMAAESEQADLPFISFSFQDSRPLDEICFKRFVEGLPFEVFRMKGPVRFTDRTVLMNHVGGRSEWMEWGRDQATRLAFVGWKVNSEDTLQKLRRCIVGSSLLHEERAES